MTVRARFDGNVFVPVEPVDIPKDQMVELDVRESTDPPRGSPAALLKLLRSMTPIPKEDLDALERAIEEGKRPVRYEGIFDDLR